MRHVGCHWFRENIRNGQCHPITEYPHTHPISQQDLVQTTVAGNVITFPKNAVGYFVSHYDYYQPEAYLPKRDLYIEKELSMNERIEQGKNSPQWLPLYQGQMF
ncbi:MAG: hypothetical protein Ct9H90mP16_06960 [Candidatus Poseidoniales archaeon]|nr:MAG: hypothetical protein Ct9H90mP16_06960 [Candidatus Poseidoniales archaeon]